MGGPSPKKIYIPTEKLCALLLHYYAKAQNVNLITPPIIADLLGITVKEVERGMPWVLAKMGDEWEWTDRGLERKS